MTFTIPHPVTIRIATPDDAARLVDIYRPYVESTAITFENEVPSVAAFAHRIASTLERYPYLVAVDADGNIVGYAYAGPLKERVACDWAAETSVYLDKSACRCGIGTMLYDSLIDLLLLQHVTNLYACITYANQEDHLYNHGSVRFHDQMGFKIRGHFHECGYKFGRWWDVVWSEKIIAPHLPQQQPFIPFNKLTNRPQQ